MKKGLRIRSREGYSFALFAVLILSCFAFGGSSRADAYSQFFVRAAAIVALAVSLVRLQPGDLDRVRVPLLLLGLWAALMIFQLIPLPPSWWEAMPGRAQFVNLADAAWMEQPWRPISLNPDATLNSLASLIVPASVLVSFSAIRKEQYGVMFYLLLSGIVASGIIGVVQAASGGAFLYFYEITNTDSAVGLFANRNHEAALLASAVPILAAIVRYPSSNRERQTIFSAILFILIFPMIFLTGSRAGLIILLAGCIGGYFVFRSAGARYEWQLKRAHKIGLLLTLCTIFAGTALMVILDARAIERLLAMDIEADLRLVLFDTVQGMAKDYFPWGVGFGVFPDAFKIYEPDWHLGPRYYNHAHNDAIEIIIEGGVGALCLILAFFFWWAKCLTRLRKVASARAHLLGVLGTVLLPMLLLASLSDYPLRTPLLAALFALGAGFMSTAISKESR